MHTAQYWIDRLNLLPHPEGGYYRQTYESGLHIEQAALPSAFTGSRRASTAIYFLLAGEDFSALHRLASDEVWHFYTGGSLLVHSIDPAGKCKTARLGPNPETGDQFQYVVPAGCWFGSSLVDPDSYALVGCTVAPGFDFADFELARRAELCACHPRHRALIEQLTRR